MKELIFESTIKETKNNYTTTTELIAPFPKYPVIKKTLFGIEIQRPTSYRIYKSGNSVSRTWVFGDIEINVCDLADALKVKK